MGNSTSQARRSSVSYDESTVRKSSTSKTVNQNLDEEFSDLILHEVKKNQTVPQANKLDKFSNDLIEDEFNELNDLIETDASELSRNIIEDNNASKIPDGNPMNDIEIDNNYISAQTTLDDMDIDSNSNPTVSPDSTTPDLSTVDFTKVISNPSSQPIRHMGTVPNRGPHGGISSPSNYSYSTNIPAPASATTTPATTLPPIPTNTFGNTKLVNVEIKWVNIPHENIQKISIIGSFSNWRNIIRLRPSSTHSNEFVVTIKLPLGVHKLLYIINNEYRVSEQLPTATDQEGIFFNWFEVLDDQHLFNHSQNQPNRTNASTKYDANIIQSAGQIDTNDIQRTSNSSLGKLSKDEPNFEHVEYSNDSGTNIKHLSPRPMEHVSVQAQLNPISPERFDPYISMSDNNSSSFLLNQEPQELEYSNDIPEIFVNYNYFKSQHADFELPEPPQLPAHLNNVLLNKLSNSAASTNTSHSHHHGSLQSMGFKTPSSSHSDHRPPLRRADSSYYASNREAYHLSIPNHVILNHLMTTSIRNDVLTVACITRYSGKFVTQIMHSPADT